MCIPPDSPGTLQLERHLIPGDMPVTPLLYPPPITPPDYPGGADKVNSCLYQEQPVLYWSVRPWWPDHQHQRHSPRTSNTQEHHRQ